MASKQTQRRQAVIGTTSLGKHGGVKPRHSADTHSNPRIKRVMPSTSTRQWFYRADGEKLWRVNQTAFN